MAFEPHDRRPATGAPWLTLVGIGADGVQSLTLKARRAVEQAAFVAGSRRQLELVQALVTGKTLTWPSPFEHGVAQVLARRGLPTCVLASGDPFFYGVGNTFSRHLAPVEWICHPAPTSMSLAAARLGWALEEVDVVSLHGRDLHTLIRFLAPGRRVIALSWDRTTPAQLARLLDDRGFGESSLVVLEALDHSDERVRRFRATELACAEDAARPEFADLNLVALELLAAPQSLPFAVRGCLPDHAFEHDGQLTKQDVRAITLSALAPRPGTWLWDVGAGSGSIGIEWQRSHPACRAIAIERDPERCQRIARNARALGVPSLEIIEGSAPACLQGLRPPDAVFIGGGGADPGVFAACWRALPRGGRLVLHAVSLETEALVLALYAEHGGELRRLSIETAAQLGSMTAFRPALPIVQWRVDKP